MTNPDQSTKTTIRLPLQLGTSSLWSMARVCSTLVPGAILAVSAFVFGSIHVWLGMLGLYLVLYAVLQLFEGWKTRPSDVMLTDNDFQIDGGPHHGLNFNWNDIEPTACKIEDSTATRLTVIYLWEDILKLAGAMALDKVRIQAEFSIKAVQKVPIRQFWVATKDDQTLLLARAEAPEEQRALTALHGSFQSRLGTAPPAETPNEEGSAFLCTSCSAALLPVATPTMVCPFCSTENKVPKTLQDRVKTQQSITEDRQESSLLVSELLDQPGAQKAGQILTTLGIASAIIWLLILFILTQASYASMGSFELFWGLFAGSTFVLSFFTWTRMALVKRRALNLLTADFGARAPPPRRGCPKLSKLWWATSRNRKRIGFLPILRDGQHSQHRYASLSKAA